MSLFNVSKEKLASIVENLDEVANRIQANGLIKEAEEIDIISNTIEKMSEKIPQGSDRPAPIFSDSDSKVKDGKDHFPIPDEAHARNALQRVNQYSAAPDWYDGSLEEVKKKVMDAVKNKFPDIEIDEGKYKEAAKKQRAGAIFQGGSPNVTDGNDHFPIPDAAHARNALARVDQYSSAPSWYNGTLSSLKAAVRRAVHSKYPSIKISK
jgi:hypothetical protein